MLYHNPSVYCAILAKRQISKWSVIADKIAGISVLMNYEIRFNMKCMKWWERTTPAIFSWLAEPKLKHIEAETNGRHFADDIFKCIFLNENVWIPIKISLKFVPKGPINNIPAMVQIMAWRRPGDKPLFEPMVVNLPTHICVTRPQWL